MLSDFFFIISKCQTQHPVSCFTKLFNGWRTNCISAGSASHVKNALVVGARPAHGKEDRLVADEGGVAEALGTFPVRAEERNPRTVVSMENDCGLLKEADRLQVLQEIAKRPVETA